MWDDCVPITVFFYTYRCTGSSILIIAPNFPTCQNPGKKKSLTGHPTRWPGSMVGDQHIGSEGTVNG